MSELDDRVTSWLQAELEDNLDEDYELELGDSPLSVEIAKIYQGK